MIFQHHLWELQENEPQEISQAESTQIYNGEPIYYFGNIDNEQQDREQFGQAKQQLIELLEKVTNTIPDHDPNATDQQGNPKSIDKQPLINFRHKVYNHFTYNISLDTRQSLLNPVKKELEDLYTNHGVRLEQAKGFTPNTLELNLNDQDFNICWQGVANKLREFIDSVRLDKSFHQLVVKAKRQMLWGLASFYVAYNRDTRDSEVHTTARYFNCLALIYGLKRIEWESSSVYDTDKFLEYIERNRDNAFWEKLIALIDNYFPYQVDDEMNLITYVRDLMGEVVPKADNNVWTQFYMDESLMPGCLEEQTRQRLARLCTSYLMIQQGFLSPAYCTTLKVYKKTSNGQAEHIEALASKRLLPEHGKWVQQPSEQPSGNDQPSDDQSQADRDAEVSSSETGSFSRYTGSASQATSRTETLYYYITAEDIFIHTEQGVIRPASQADLMLIKDDLKNYQLPVPATNLQYLDRSFIFKLNCSPSITIPSLSISLSGDSQKLLEDLASDYVLKNYIKRRVIHNYELLMMNIEGVNYDPYKIKSPLMRAMFWQIYKESFFTDDLTDENKQFFQILTGCNHNITINALNDWLINNRGHPFLRGANNLTAIRHLFWQIYEKYQYKDRFSPRDTQFLQLVTGYYNLKTQSALHSWLFEEKNGRLGGDLPLSLLMFAAQNNYKKAVQDFYSQCFFNRQVFWHQFTDSYKRNIWFIALSQPSIAYDFLSEGACKLSNSILNSPNNFDNKTPLHYMAEKGSVDVLDWLIDNYYRAVPQLLTDLSNQRNSLKRNACQLALANHQQAFLNRCFELMIQQQVTGNSYAAHVVQQSIKRLFERVSKDQITILIKALTYGIVTALNDHNSTPSKMPVVRLLLANATVKNEFSLLYTITQYQQVNFFSKLLNDQQGRKLILKLLGVDQEQLETSEADLLPTCWRLILKNNNSREFFKILVNQLAYQEFYRFIEQCLESNKNVVKNLFEEGHNEFLNILNELKPNWALSLLGNSYLGKKIICNAVETDNTAVLDTYARVAHDKRKLKYLIEQSNVFYFAQANEYSTAFTARLFELWPDIAKEFLTNLSSSKGENGGLLYCPLDIVFEQDNRAQLGSIEDAFNDKAQFEKCLKQPRHYFSSSSVGSYSLCFLKRSKPDTEHSQVLQFLLERYSELTKQLLSEKASGLGVSPFQRLFYNGVVKSDIEKIETQFGREFFGHLLKNQRDHYNETVLHYACRGELISNGQSDPELHRARIIDNIEKLFIDYPDIAKDLLKTPSKIEAGYFYPGRTPVYYLIKNCFHEILDTAIHNIGRNEFLKLLQHDSAAFQGELDSSSYSLRNEHYTNFICKLREHFSEEQLLPLLDNPLKTSNKCAVYSNSFQRILLSIIQYNQDSPGCLNRLLDQFRGHIDQLLLNGISENNQLMQQVLIGIESSDADNHHDRVSWYKNVLDQLDQYSTIMPALLCQKETIKLGAYWKRLKEKGLVSEQLDKRLKIDCPDKIKVHMLSLLTVLSKQRDVKDYKRDKASEYLNCLQTSDYGKNELKELFCSMVIEMGKHQFWRQGINADKANSIANIDQLPNELHQFYYHLDAIRDALRISNQDWCGVLKGQMPRLNLSSNPYTFDSDHSQQAHNEETPQLGQEPQP